MSRVRRRWVVGSVVVATLLAYPMARGVRSLAMTRGGMSTFARLVGSANAGDLEAVRSLCSGRFREAHPVVRSAEGGVVGLPRNIHKNFRVWSEGDDVLICPSDREGAVYRVIREPDGWKFDGLVGLLRRGRVVAGESDRQSP